MKRLGSAVIPFAPRKSDSEGTFNPSISWTYDIPLQATLLSGPKNSMQERIERIAGKAAEEAFVEIERSKEEVKSRWPSVWEGYITTIERWQDIRNE